jgi:phospholipase C
MVIRPAPLAFPAIALSTLFAVAAACGSEPPVGGDPYVPTADAGSSSGNTTTMTDGNVVSCSADEALCKGACGPISQDDARCGPGDCAVACTGGKHCSQGACVASKIEHVVVIVQENHTFDNHFGKYCQASAGSNPKCTEGRNCCEGPPKVNGVYTEPSGSRAQLLDDATNFKSDHDHDRDCEVAQINGGAMDRFVSGVSGGSTCLGIGPKCSDPSNFALAEGEAPSSTVHDYWVLADKYALADRYFQPMAGGSACNDIYFAEARFRFVDNQVIPDVTVGNSTSKSARLCTQQVLPQSCVNNQRGQFDKPTIASLMLDQGKTFAVYADGYGDALAAQGQGGDCADPANASDCRYKNCSLIGGNPVACHACLYDPSDTAFLYYKTFGDVSRSPLKPTPYVKDYNTLKADLVAQKLPNFAFVKARSARNEHPNVSNISDGVAFVKATVDMVLASASYKDNTLILLTWDEGGGYYDHVSPPKSVPTSIDSDAEGRPVPYGTRVPFLAIGPFAKKGHISHAEMEHSSVVRFLEWNFLTSTGQLRGRDTVVNNLGSLLDQSKTGIAVPEK